MIALQNKLLKSEINEITSRYAALLSDRVRLEAAREEAENEVAKLEKYYL